MIVSYYPGCSLEGTAREYDESVRAVCQALDIELAELEDWTCCGASSAHSIDDYLSLALPARNLAMAARKGLDLVVPCAACYQRFKAAQKRLVEGAAAPEIPSDKVKVKHLLDLLCEEPIREKIEARLAKPLAGLKAVSYYGCLTVRPPKVTGAADYEDPKCMDELLAWLGAQSRPWSYKTDCCGGSLALARTDVVRRLTHRLLQMAREAGAECLVTACPMCQANLDTRQQEVAAEFNEDYHLPIFYFTELMGLAFGHPDVARWWKGHFVDPTELLRSKGLVEEVGSP